MKLAIAVLAAVAESKPKRPHNFKHKPKLNPDNDERWIQNFHIDHGHIKHLHKVPAKECPADSITSTETLNGQEGTVLMADHEDHEHCFVNLGEKCSNGVDVEITQMSIESYYHYYKDMVSDTPESQEWWAEYYGMDLSSDYCFDAVFFTYKQDDEQKKTDQQCGCIEDTDGCRYVHDYTYEWDWTYNRVYYDLQVTRSPTKYWLNGDDTKMIFHSDRSQKGGYISVDWKCHEDPNVNWNICPSKTCYTQYEGWSPGKEVSCTMTNPDCLNVSCSSNSIQAIFDADLFHTNLENEESFLEQLESGHREMWYNGNKLELNAPCGFTLTADGVQIDWAYDLCNVTPTMNADEEIVYSVSLSSPGNAPGYETIEFYVDTAVEASCAYDSKIVVKADGFWVNQEDVEAAGNAMGKLDGTFDCKFFKDEARNNQILSNNIVNMGEMIYGQVTSRALTGLSYDLVGVTVTNANNLAMSFPVIDGGVPSPDVRASSDGSAETGQSVNFSYLSFGFESDTGSNQNEINIECAVDLFVNIVTTTTTTTTTSSTTTFSEWETNHPYNPCWHDMDAVCVTQCDGNGNCYYVNIADQLPGK